MRTGEKKQRFMINVSIILFAQIAVKLLGFVYRIVITNMGGFGDMGSGYLSAGYNIYTMLLAISSVGIPTAISKMVSEKYSLGDYAGAHRIFKTAFFLFAIVGAVCSVLLYAFAPYICKYIINMEGAVYTLQCLAPSIFFVCISSVISGYFLGMQITKVTSTWQVLEQIFKCTLTILFVYLVSTFMGQIPEFMSAGANLATTVSTLLSFGFLFVYYNLHKKDIWRTVGETKVESEKLSSSRLIRNIVMISIPVSLGSIITSIARVIDTATITRGIEAAFKNGIPGMAGIPTASQLADEAVRLAGMLSKGDAVVNMPMALNIALATVLVPAISAALAIGDKKEAVSKVNFSMLVSVLLILPCATGMAVLAEPIYKLIYPNASQGYELMQIGTVAMLFSALDQTVFGALQGLGKVFIPALALICGVVSKIILNIILIRIPGINIYGAAVSSCVCHLLAFCIAFRVLAKNLSMKFDFKKLFLKPVIACVIMGVFAVLVYNLSMLLTGIFMDSYIIKNMISVVVSVGIAVIVYGAAVIFLKVLSKDEIEMLPFGGAIARKLGKMKIYK